LTAVVAADSLRYFLVNSFLDLCLDLVELWGDLPDILPRLSASFHLTQHGPESQRSYCQPGPIVYIFMHLLVQLVVAPNIET